MPQKNVNNYYVNDEVTAIKKTIFTSCKIEKVIYYATLKQQLRTKAYKPCRRIEVIQVAFCSTKQETFVACSIFVHSTKKKVS